MAGKNSAAAVLEELKLIGLVGQAESVSESEDDDGLSQIRGATAALTEALEGLVSSAKQVQEAVSTFQTVLEESMTDVSEETEDVEDEDTEDEE